MALYRAEIEQLATDLQELVGRSATPDRVVSRASLRNLPQVLWNLPNSATPNQIAEAIYRELDVALGKLSASYEIPSLGRSVTAESITRAVRVILNYGIYFRQRDHKPRRLDAIRILDADCSVDKWRRKGDGPEYDLMRVVATQLYSDASGEPTEYAQEQLERTFHIDHRGVLTRLDTAVHIRSFKSPLTALCHYSHYRKDARPGVAHFEALTGCRAGEQTYNQYGVLRTTVELIPPLELDSTMLLTFREAYWSDVPTDVSVGLRSNGNIGRYRQTVSFAPSRPPRLVSFFEVDSEFHSPTYPDAKYKVGAKGNSYFHDFGATRSRWVYGFIWSY